MDDERERKPVGCGLFMIYKNVFRRQPSSSSSTTPQSTHPTPKTSVVVVAPSNTNYDHNDNPHAKVHAPPSATLNSSNPPKVGSGGKPLPDSSTIRPMSGTGRGQHHGHGGGGGGISMELDSVINDYQRTKGNSTLVRASSGNVMLYGNLGNLHGPGAITTSTMKQQQQQSYGNGTRLNEKTRMTNATVSSSSRNNKNDGDAAAAEEEVPAPSVMCRALSKRLDPEELKEMGNEEYKQGNFAEALALYDRAILMDPDKASYWSNKAAALTSLGKLIEAVTECREAVRIEPSYYRAHHRLATLYFRLGEAEKSLHHYKLSRTEANPADISRSQSLQKHFSKCLEARQLKDWHSVLKETQSAISSGVDSSPQVFAFKAEALLMLHKHEEADAALKDTPKFDIDTCTKFFGAMKNAFVLIIQAQVDIAAGRFEDALSVANKAARLDTSSGEAGAIARKARAIASARATGNDLFKASKFEEACAAYGEGLHHHSNNAILMCNRAACLSKLGQWDKAIEDCTIALNLRPSYTKARLRRADCYTKLEQWEASVQDYEALLREMPEDEEIRKALSEAQMQLNKV